MTSKTPDTNTPKFLYRAFARQVDEYCDAMEIQFEKYKIQKRTPRGFWIYAERRHRWVSDYHRGRFAYPTQAQALENLKHRQSRYIEIMECRIKGAKKALELIEVEQRVQAGGSRFKNGDRVYYGLASSGKVVGFIKSPGTGRHIYRVWNRATKEEKFIPENELKLAE